MNDELGIQYLQSLTDKLEGIKTLVREYKPGNKDVEQDIRTLAHSLHGSGATFGYPEISEAAQAVELAADADLFKKLTVLVKVLKDVVSRAAPPPPEPTVEEIPQAAAPAASQLDPVPQGQTRILVIDDDPDSTSVFIELIRRRLGDVDVVVAANAADAQELLVRQSFSLIVLDLMLPDRDGRELLREIKMEFRLATPLLVLSAINRDVVRVECMSLGADRYLIKPFDPYTVAEDVMKLLSKNEKPGLALVPHGAEVIRRTPRSHGQKVDVVGRLVLLAEDDQMQANFIRQRLTQEGLKVEHVDNGRAALDALKTKEYSLVILDMKMPLVDGFEVLKTLRVELGLVELPVIVLSALGKEEDIIRGYNLGADDYILKPFSAVQLIARVKTLLR